jgi:hypothetical protein
MNYYKPRTTKWSLDYVENCIIRNKKFYMTTHFARIPMVLLPEVYMDMLKELLRRLVK